MEDLYLDQEKFMKKVLKKKGFELSSMTEADRVFWTKETILAMIKELTEVLDNLDWKPHRKKTDGSLHLPNLTEELIDGQKFLWNMMILWGMTPEDVRDMYMRKSFVVEERWRQESNVIASPTLIVDLDGVLCQYPQSFINWVKKYHPEASKLDKQKNPIEWEDLKNEYRLSGGKREALPTSGANIALDDFKKAGWSVVVLTHRPISRYKNIEFDTFHWLHKNEMKFDKVVWAALEKSFYLRDEAVSGEVFVDDHFEICKTMINLVKRVYCIGLEKETDGVLPAKSLLEVANHEGV